MVLALAVVVVLGGAGTAWAMTRSSGPSYRIARVQRADVTQTVDADGTIATVHSASLAFATSGTVQALHVHDGDKVRAGEVVARLDRSALSDAVVSAQQTLASAKQKLASDESAQSTTAATTAATTGTHNAIVLTAAVRTMASNDPAVSAVVHAQRAVVRAQHRLDDAVSNEDDAIDAATTACAQTDDTTPVTVSTTADSSGVVQGTVGGQAVTATLLDADGSTDHTTSSSNPQAVAAGGSYRFAGLTDGGSYQVSVVRSGKVIDTATCTSALAAVQRQRATVDAATGTVDSDVSALTAAVGALQRGGSSSSGAPSSGTTPTDHPTAPASGQSSGGVSTRPTQQPTTRPSGATSSGAAVPSQGSVSSGATGGTNSSATGSSAVTAQQIVADQRSIDAARAALRLAEQNRGLAVLRAPIGGTVAAVGISTGQSVSTTTTALQIVGSGRKSVTVDIGLAKIDMVHAGQRASVTVDGHTASLSGRVTQVGLTNTSSSTGSSATYAVTVVLDATPVHLFDGMGASVSIGVGSVRSAVSVPLSAVTTTGQISIVRVYAGGAVTPTRVTVGVQGSDRVQVKSGLRVGQQVVLAEVSAAIPSSTDTTTRRFSGFTGGLSGAGPAGP